MFAADEDPGYGTFINGGGNLILVDMDWMCASSAGCGSVDFTFASGDFAYDYFGIASGQNDPGPIDTVEVSGLGITDMDTPFVAGKRKLPPTCLINVSHRVSPTDSPPTTGRTCR